MPAKTKARILAIDDNMDDRRMVQRSLPEREFEVIVSGSGEDALAILTSAAAPLFDVFIADYHLPGMTGTEFLERAARVQPNASRLLVSADPGVERPPRITPLIKPIPPEKLLHIVQLLVLQTQRIREGNHRASHPTPSNLPAPPKKPSSR